MSKEMEKTMLLMELSKDFDWKAAAKRAKIDSKRLSTLKKDKEFLKKGQDLINQATSNIAGRAVKEAISKFEETQKTLTQMLAEGESKVASALVKTHELEYRMHGLFEKDNRQKQAPVTINISLDEPEPRQAETIDGEYTQL
jgi:hypothetical protein